MEYLVNVLGKKQRLILGFLMAGWFAYNLYFLIWWLNSEHVGNFPLFLINTIAVFWTYLLPAYFFFFAIRMKKTNPLTVIPQGLKVAIIVTKAPSEPFELVKATLIGMMNQKYPHDTWVADEDPSEEMVKWATQNRVYISSRKGIPEYNNEKWPRRKKCKEGNLAYFYDKFGFEKYDFVVQLDADHIPQENYLEEMLKPFADPGVGYVSAPSICSKNANKSWSARGRLYLEGLLHGAQQSGHTNGFAPLCFGSHYAVRTKALKQIGGLGPELAEDHSTTMIMNAFGWRGVHALDAIAIGDGPDTFADAMTQEFQWSRSLMNLLLMWTPRYISKLPLKLKIQFLFSQMWYALYSSIMLLGVLIPIIAIVMNVSPAKISYTEFLMLNIVNIMVTLSVTFYIKHLKLLRPVDSKIFCWEVFVFQIVRWPWSLFGVCTSIIDFIFKKEFAFKVTPKNRVGYIPLPMKVLTPYLLIIGVYLFSGLVFNNSNNVLGYYYFIITGSIMYLISLTTIIVMHEHENRH